jgi:pyruvate dehydrogenase E2 component (dihydrolipoamide acetyltransferase)
MTIEVLMPALSPTMTEGNLLKWHKKEGDPVSAGDMLAEIETDKATMEVEAVDEGVLGKILVPEGQEGVKVNSVIALLLEEGEDEAVLETYISRSSDDKADVSNKGGKELSESIASQSIQSETKADSETRESLDEKSERIFVTPLARRIANEKNIDLSCVSGSGPRGRIVRADIENFSLSSSQQKISPGSFGHTRYRDVPVSSMRKAIAKRLSESKQTVPHFYLSVDVEIDILLQTRKQLNDALESEKITVNDFVIKAVAQALQEIPEANASWMGETIRYYDNSDISVAVALEDGLITPIVKAANQKSLRQISVEVKELVAKAKDGSLKPDEFQGGTFSVSNLGMFGIESFQAIVNPPQGCILAVGSGVQRPLIKGGEITKATIMNCTLSVDHRVIDGKIGALFLGSLKKYLETPLLMLA